MRTGFWGAVFLPIALLAAGGGAAQEPVRREHHTVNISSGREGRIGYFASPDETCGKGIAPEITIVERPGYGRIAFRPDRLLAYTSTIPARANACRGQFVDVTAVFYKPAPRYHGSDRVVLRVFFPAAKNGPAAVLIDEIYISVR